MNAIPWYRSPAGASRTALRWCDRIVSGIAVRRCRPPHARRWRGTLRAVIAGESAAPARTAEDDPATGGGGGGRSSWRGTSGGRYGVPVRHAWSRRTTTRAARTTPLNGIPSWADALIRISRKPSGLCSSSGSPSFHRASIVTVWPRSISVRAIRQERESNSPVDGRTRTRCCGTIRSPVGGLLNGGCDGPARAGSRTPPRRRGRHASRAAS